MQAIWQTGEGVVRDFINNLTPGRQIPYTTVASIVKNLEKKRYLHSRRIAHINLYTPAIQLNEYKKEFMNGVVKDYFTNSYSDLVAFFVEQKKLSKSELEEIIELIESK